MRAYIMIVALLALAIFALVYTARTQDRTYAGFNCTVDCKGHEAGYRWAEQNGIDDEDYCLAGDSESFHEGCIAYVQGEPQAANDNGVGAEMPMNTDADDDEAAIYGTSLPAALVCRGKAGLFHRMPQRRSEISFRLFRGGKRPASGSQAALER